MIRPLLLKNILVEIYYVEYGVGHLFLSELDSLEKN